MLPPRDRWHASCDLVAETSSQLRERVSPNAEGLRSCGGAISRAAIQDSAPSRTNGPALPAIGGGGAALPSASSRHAPEPIFSLGGLDRASPSGFGPMLWTAHQRYRQHAQKLQEKRQPRANRNGGGSSRRRSSGASVSSAGDLSDPACEELSQRLVRGHVLRLKKLFGSLCLLLEQRLCLPFGRWNVRAFGHAPPSCR